MPKLQQKKIMVVELRFYENDVLQGTQKLICSLQTSLKSIIQLETNQKVEVWHENILCFTHCGDAPNRQDKAAQPQAATGKDKCLIVFC